MSMTRFQFAAVALALFFLAPLSFAAEPFELKNGDRVAFIGDALIERDIQFNYLETLLSIRYHGRGIVFRNVGWSGDTVWGESRAVFGSPADGYKALIKMIGEVQPTVAFFNYGLNESFEGKEGLARFEEGYNTLLNDLEKTAKGCRGVLLSPIAFQNSDAHPMSKSARTSDNVKLYSDAVKSIAAKRNAIFVDLHAAFSVAAEAKNPRTDNGIHLTNAGYQHFAASVDKALSGKDSVVKFAAVTGVYESIGPRAIQAASPESLRALIAAKNLQFFNRWRPQNETYLFLFRKREQGNNAKDIPEFDPIIAKMEKDINQMAGEVAKTTKP